MEALSCLPFAGAGLWDFCCSCVLGCVSSIGVFSLYSSIKPPLFIFTRNPLHWLPLFSGADPQPSVICTENYKSAAVSRQSGQPSCRPGSALCHRLSCPWLRRSGGGRGREGGWGARQRGPVRSRHGSGPRAPFRVEGAGGSCCLVPQSRTHLLGGLISTGSSRTKIGLSVKRKSLDLGGKWHPVLHRSQSPTNRAVLGSDGGAGAERCSRGRRSEAALSCRLRRGLYSHLVSAGRRNLEGVWEAVVSDVGG